ncbi:MAG: hypothetical protein Unbinned2365contig1001_32 [Prokaryotic dsDNA virus sp.]|nr:MAG: hypothetical protein Unbinned2365contig1001_32 [Prokaryotic dsDNA virus sp.]|tara:strand:- start:20275 stop:20706 length:432 start_codon:yes stop_codon:yes gene_type:complete
MKELPYFKFFPNQWITGSIMFMDLDVQGAFMKICCYYWSKECNVSRDQIKSLVPDHWNKLIDSQLLKIDNNKIKIKWLDEQYEERKEAHVKRVNAGRKGGKTTQNKQSSSNAKALRKDKIKKDKYANDNVLRVSDEVIKLLNK